MPRLDPRPLMLLLLGLVAACTTQAPAPIATAAKDIALLQADVEPDVAALPDMPSEVGAPIAQNPVINSLSPDQGPTSGLTTITISGQGFEGASAVLFGESPGLHLEPLDDATLKVDAPPRPPGIVAVTVRVPGKADVILEAAYRYVAQVSVSAVSPQAGPAQGGTLLTVTGTGFGKGTAFVVGDRLGIDPLILDEHTAVLVAPPSKPGFVAVSAANSDGSGTLKHAFTYHLAPRLDRIEPSIGPLAGGNPIRLIGEGLFASGATVELLTGTLKSSAVVVASALDGSWLTVTAPATGIAGPRDVRYTGPDGNSLAAQAYRYALQPGSTLDVLGVAPASLPANALQPVSVAVSGKVAQASLAKAIVRFNGMPAQVLGSQLATLGVGASLTVLPPNTKVTEFPHPVEVSVVLGGVSAARDQAFSYLAPVPRIVQVEPATLAAQGGTAVQITFAPTVASWGKVNGVHIGALSAANVAPEASSSPGVAAVHAVAPKGSPGPADVVLHFAGGQTLVASGAVVFAAPHPTVAALIPATGAQAGGTWVSVIGSGLDQLDTLEIGGHVCPLLEHVDGGLGHIRTPAGQPGLAALRAAFTDGTLQFQERAFTYFDPHASDGGTWGSFIDGSVNVTVTAKGSGKRVEGALVTLGHDAATPYQGLTDARGQVTLSGAGLSGPVDVHATKAGFSAGSIVAVATENVTIRLTEFPKPPDGSGSPPPVDDSTPLPDGTLQGTVLDAEKYTQFPRGSCLGHLSVAGNCAPCKVDGDCGATLSCDNGSSLDAGGFCAAPCASIADCPGDFECRKVSEGLAFRCLPRIGTPQIRCESSSGSIFGGNAPAGPGGIVGSDHSFSIAAHPGDVAVVCWSGYLNAQGSFVKLAMGLARRLSIFPGETISGIEVRVHVPLDRRVRVRMVAVPMGPDASGQRSMTAGLDLGAEGYIPIASQTTMTVTDVFDLEGQPGAALFSGDNSDVRYEFYGGVANMYGGSPNSTAIGTNQDVSALGTTALWAAGTAEPVQSEAIGTSMHGADARGNLAIAVGDRGRIAAWTGGGFSLQPSPTARDLFAVWLPPGSDQGWIGGDQGTLLHRTSLGWQLWTQSAAARVVALSGRKTDDAWLLDAQGQLGHWNGQVWSAVPGPNGKPPTGYPPYGAPAYNYLHGLWQAPSGNLYLVGDGGTFLRSATATAAPLAFTTLTTFTTRNIHAIWGRSDSDIWLCGERGWLGHWDGALLTTLTTGVDQPLYAVRSFGKDFPVFALGGQGTWLRVDGLSLVHNASLPHFSVDLRGVLPTLDGGAAAIGEPVVLLGPYLEMPYPTQPTSGTALGKEVAWVHAPGVTPTLSIVRIADQTYTTRWEMFVRGSVDQVQLPDFEAMGSLNPLPPGPLYVRIWRVLAPGLEVDHFGAKQLNMGNWTSWAYNVVTSTEPAPAVGAAAGWHIEPAGNPGRSMPPKTPSGVPPGK